MKLCGIRVIFLFCVTSRKDCAFSELYVLLVPTQNQDIWNFYGSLVVYSSDLILTLFFVRIETSNDKGHAHFIFVRIQTSNDKGQKLYFLYG